MSKDKEWLKEEIKNNIQLKLDHRYGLMSGEYIGTHMLEAIIDQLDEPEVLSQEWIDEHKRVEGQFFVEYEVVPVKDLQNLLVPKQDEPETLSQEWVEDNFFEVENWDDEVFISDGETAIDGTPQIKVIALQDLKKVVNITRELPTIPQFVAEVIEEHKELGYDVYDSIDLIIETNGGGLPSISNWVARNIDKYARAWLAYPNIKIEKEPHPILKAFDEKAEEFKKYSDSYRRIQEIRAAIEDVIEEEA